MEKLKPKVGDWVCYDGLNPKLRGAIGLIDCVYETTASIVFVKGARGENMGFVGLVISHEYLVKLEPFLLDCEIDSLINLALDLKDFAWLKELSDMKNKRKGGKANG